MEEGKGSIYSGIDRLYFLLSFRNTRGRINNADTI